MPCIVMYTNMEVPKEKAEELKKALVVSWEKLPRRARFRASLFHRRYASEKNSARGLDAQSSAMRASSARRKTCW